MRSRAAIAQAYRRRLIEDMSEGLSEIGGATMVFACTKELKARDSCQDHVMAKLQLLFSSAPLPKAPTSLYRTLFAVEGMLG